MRAETRAKTQFRKVAPVSIENDEIKYERQKSGYDYSKKDGFI